jgi:hypothetical protein
MDVIEWLELRGNSFGVMLVSLSVTMTPERVSPSIALVRE